MFDHLSVGVRDLDQARRFYDAFLAPLGHAASSPVDVHVGQVRRFVGRLTTTDAGTAVRVERTSGDHIGGGVS